MNRISSPREEKGEGQGIAFGVYGASLLCKSHDRDPPSDYVAFHDGKRGFPAAACFCFRDGIARHSAADARIKQLAIIIGSCSRFRAQAAVTSKPRARARARSRTTRGERSGENRYFRRRSAAIDRDRSRATTIETFPICQVCPRLVEFVRQLARFCPSGHRFRIDSGRVGERKERGRGGAQKELYCWRSRGTFCPFSFLFLFLFLCFFFFFLPFFFCGSLRKVARG